MVVLTLINLKQRILTFYLHPNPAGTSIPTHTHDTDNHGVITRGELILTMNGVTTKVSTGDWYHVPANIEHSAEFEVETDEVEFWFRENT